MNEAAANFDPERVLSALRDARRKLEAVERERRERIAIIGMAGRFPGAESVEALWSLLARGETGIAQLSAAELEAAGVPASVHAQKDYVRAYASFEDPTAFDAGFFGYSPREAEILDPQHRVFLECAWAALEDAAYDTRRYAGRIGVYAGSALNAYLVNLHGDAKLREAANPVQVVVGNVMGLMPTRVSYHLDLKGPSCGIQTGCSTSLVAVHMACRSLLDGDCDIALAGGVTIGQARPAGYRYEEGGIASPDGRCRAFDAAGRGTVFGNGVGVVVLKRLSAALADGDHIHALIDGSAINNDGADKVGLLAPSVAGQAAVIERAIERAGIEPASLSYVETHGTATMLGDPIEFAALERALGGALRAAGARCALGSVKTNLGHLDAAAGIAGLIKTVLALRHAQLPASLGYERPNPQIDFANSPFHVNGESRAWPRAAGPRRAGVSSFGMGGTNAHVVLEEAPAPTACAEAPAEAQLLLLSAQTASALARRGEQLAARLRSAPALPLADVAYTLQVGRRALKHRRWLVCRDTADAIAQLTQPPAAAQLAVTDEGAPSLVFLFPGQGSQYPGMAGALYARCAEFRATIDRAAELLGPEVRLREAVCSKAPADWLQRTEQAQPILFAIEYALASLWRRLGLEPAALIGHSLGEYAAACVAGVFSFEDGLALVAARGRLMQQCAPGAMLAVLDEEAALRPLLGEANHGGLELAALNGARHCVVAGAPEAIADLERELAGRDVACRRLATSHAFHSALMEPALDAFEARVRAVRLAPPQLDLVSNLTGDWLSAAEATDPTYWRRHLRQTVLFGPALARLAELPRPVYLEVGPGEVLGKLVRAQLGAATRIVASLPEADAAEPLLEALGRLWLANAPVAWNALHGGAERRRVSLPTYPFERSAYFVERSLDTAGATLDDTSAESRLEDPAQWCHVPGWQRLPQTARGADPSARWLVFGDPALKARVGAQSAGIEQIWVMPGAQYAESGDTYTVEPAARADHGRLLAALAARDWQPTQIVYLWPLTAAADARADFEPLLALAQALADANPEALLLSVATRGLHGVLGDETLAPNRACVLGLCQVLPQEIAGLRCRVLEWPLARAADDDGFVADLVRELCSDYDAQARLVAFRGPHRWVQHYAPLPLPAAAPPLVPRGLYLVAGDLVEGLGLIQAEALRRHADARLILIGRPGLPAAEAWEQWLATHGARHPVSRLIRRLQALGREGEDYRWFSADLADRARLAAILDECSARWGKLAGVFHTAPMGDDASCPLGELDAATTARIFHGKLAAVAALAAALEPYAPPFVLLQSSLSTIVGGSGFGAYAAANAWLDVFAAGRHGPTRWAAIDWDACRTDDAPEAAHSALLSAALSAEEVWEATCRVLADGRFPQVLVSPRPLAPRLAQAYAPRAIPLVAAASAHGRPDLLTPYVAPRNDIERAVAAAMGELLGIAQIGVDDDFFALGGHSLLAIQAVTRLRKEFKVELPMRAFLHGTPTVAGIAKVIEDNLGALPTDSVTALEALLERIETMSPEEAARQL